MILQPAGTAFAFRSQTGERSFLTPGGSKIQAGEGETLSTPGNATRISSPSDAVNPSNSGTANQGPAPDKLQKATASDALRNDAFPITTQSGYGQIEVEWDEVTGATGYAVSRSAKADGIFLPVAALGADSRSYMDPVGTGVTYFYKVTADTPDGKAESRTVQANYTSMKSLTDHAVIHKEFPVGNQTFDGNRAVNLSEEEEGAANSLQEMDRGTVIMKVREARANAPVGVLLGLKGEEASLPSPDTLENGSLAGTKTAAIMAKGTGIRYSFDHTRANGSQSLTPGQWTTLVFTNAGSEAAKVLRLYVGGKDAGSFSGAANAGFFKTSGIGRGNTTLTIGGLINPEDSSVEDGFQGDIAYVTVTNELLTDSEAQEISSGAGESDILRAFSLSDPSNTWVITGGRNAAGLYQDIGSAKNYASLFEEAIRWDQADNERNGMQRFVFNTAREGLTANQVNRSYDKLIGAYLPKGVAILLGSDDLNAPPQEAAASLRELIEKNNGLENPAYTVIQLPIPSSNAETNQRIEALIGAVESMVSELPYPQKRMVVVVDHYSLLKDEDMTKLRNAQGYLNAQGQLAVANQLLEATIGCGSQVTEDQLSQAPKKAPIRLEETPQITIGDTFLSIKAPPASESWSYRIDVDGTSVCGTLKGQGVVGKLPHGCSFTLSMVSEDQAMRLPDMEGVLKTGEEAHMKNKMDTLTEPQKQLKKRLEDPEPMHWLFIGDGITQGSGDTSGHDSEPQLFEKYLHEELLRSQDVVLNTGVAGATTRDFLNHQDVRLDRYPKADVVVLQFGTEDAKNKVVGTGSFRRNLEHMVDEIQKNGAMPILCTPVKTSSDTGSLKSNLPAYAAIVRDVAKDRGAILADYYGVWEKDLYAQSYLDHNGYLQNGSYPSASGQLLMTQNLIRSLGMNTEKSPICGLYYPVAAPVTSRGILPPVKSTKTSITVNTAYLQKQAKEGMFGTVTVMAESEGVTYKKTVRKDSEAQLQSVTLNNLPTGQEYKLTVEAGLVNTPNTIRFQLRKIVLDGTVNDSIPNEIEGLIYEMDERSFDGTGEKALDLSKDVSMFQSMTQGTLHFRFRVADPEQSADAGLQTLFSISDNRQDGAYADFYVQPDNGVIGVEMRQPGRDDISISSRKVNMKNTDWHSATFVSDQSAGSMTAYVDGVEVFTVNSDYFLNIENSNTVRLGNLWRQRGDRIWVFKGDINTFQVYDRPLTPDEVMALQQPTILKQKPETLPETARITEPIDLFYGGYDHSSNYRIPSLLTTKDGTVIAAADQRRSGSMDAGDIATVIRRSMDGGRSWGGVKQLIDLPAGASYHSFTIDSSMLQDQVTGRVFLLVDMFPESTALMSGSPIQMASSGYKEVDGKRYLILMNRDKTKTFTLRENGQIYLEEESGSAPTDYTVPVPSNGALYKNGIPAGNIYLYTGTQAGELSVLKTSYLWLTSSDDDGATWSNPICLNGQVKKDWMVFLGTGPGVGIQIRHGDHQGRLVFPVYYTNANGLAASQSSAVIYSDDNGVTWKIGESPNDGRDGINTETMNNSSKILTESQVVEVGSNGRLKLFCRNQSGHVMVATSDDGGESWRDTVVPDDGLYDSYCQLSIVPYPEKIDGKPAYVFSNPASPQRNNGTVRIGLYDEGTDTFDWKYSQLIWEGKYQYSCVSVMPDGEIGVFFEGDQPNMRFLRMTPDWITAPRFYQTSGPAITGVAMERSDSGILFTVTFNRPMMKMGTPVLKLKADGRPREAVYVSGNAENQYQFLYTPVGTERELMVTNVFGGDNSYIGDVHNELPKDVDYHFQVQEAKQNPEQIKDELSQVLNDDSASAKQKQIAATTAARKIQALNLDWKEVGTETMDSIAYMEHAYIWNNPDVLDTLVNSTYVSATVRGAALSVPADTSDVSRIRIEIEKAPLPSHLPNGLIPGRIAAMDITMALEQSDGYSAVTPLVPFELTFDLPSGISPKDLVVIHCHNGKQESIPFTINHNQVTVVLGQLSTFVVANQREGTDTRPSHVNSSSSVTVVPTGPVSLRGSWIDSDKGWWFKKTNGTYPADSWAFINGSWYHFDVHGYMQTGWYQDKDAKWYYLKTSGAMAANEWILDSGKWYYLYTSGEMAANITIGNRYDVGADGAWIDPVNKI